MAAPGPAGHAVAGAGVRARAAGQSRGRWRDRAVGARRAATRPRPLHRGGARRGVRAVDARRPTAPDASRLRAVRLPARRRAVPAGPVLGRDLEVQSCRACAFAIRCTGRCANSRCRTSTSTSTRRSRKTLRSYSRAFDLRRIDSAEWVTRADSCWAVHDRLAALRHYPLVTPAQGRALAPRDPFERRVDGLVQFARAAGTKD